MNRIELDTMTGRFGPDFAEVKQQVGKIVREASPGHDMTRIERVFDLLECACDGRLEEYQKLQTPYHDYQHTLEVTLCAARLVHGLHVADCSLDDESIDVAMIGALLHDTGYIKHATEHEGTGAQFTADHVSRSVEFVRTHLSEYGESFLSSLSNAILITDHRLAVDRLAFSSEEERLAAMVTGTADLVAQMASRVYLERLMFLYFEFKEAGLGSYEEIDDMLERTADFYRSIDERLKEPLQDLSRYLAHHFAKAEGAAGDLYRESIDRNLAYLKKVLTQERGERVKMLKRGGIVDQALNHHPS